MKYRGMDDAKTAGAVKVFISIQRRRSLHNNEELEREWKEDGLQPMLAYAVGDCVFGRCRMHIS
jgi:hypothetical protein